jgi:hypothetical protein
LWFVLYILVPVLVTPFGPKYHAKIYLAEGIKCVETIFSVIQVQSCGGSNTALGTLSWEQNNLGKVQPWECNLEPSGPSWKPKYKYETVYYD